MLPQKIAYQLLCHLFLVCACNKGREWVTCPRTLWNPVFYQRAEVWILPSVAVFWEVGNSLHGRATYISPCCLFMFIQARFRFSCPIFHEAKYSTGSVHVDKSVQTLNIQSCDPMEAKALKTPAAFACLLADFAWFAVSFPIFCSNMATRFQVANGLKRNGNIPISEDGMIDFPRNYSKFWVSASVGSFI